MLGQVPDRPAAPPSVVARLQRFASPTASQRGAPTPSRRRHGRAPSPRTAAYSLWQRIGRISAARVRTRSRRSLPTVTARCRQSRSDAAAAPRLACAELRHRVEQTAACRDGEDSANKRFDRRLPRPCCPAYITTTRCAISATTPRSWVISTIAASIFCFSSRIRSRICAWIVTSSAVVGSSAINSFGSAGERHRDHHPLPHAARELVRVLVDTRRSGSGICDQPQHLDRAAHRVVAAERPAVQDQRLGDLTADGQHRVERRHRLLEDHRDRDRREPCASRARRSSSRSRPSKRMCLPTDASGRRCDQPQNRKRGDALAAAGLADDRQASPRGRRERRRRRRRAPRRRG